ncbi:class II fructose-bisphosphate aldolase [Candidatus Aerophobetes bacterium]|nr:class II fructose-bisphosphate aldolase [Candidatus Aerophobetes bacterium]
MSLGTGRELKELFQKLSPFEPDGKLKPESERVTLLASNVNIPFEIQMSAFVQASVVGEGSPQIIQISHNAAKIAGRDPKKTSFLEGTTRKSCTRPAVIGAQRGKRMLEEFVEDFSAKLIFLSLDHFTAPSFDAGRYSASQGKGGLNRSLSKARLEEAIEVMKPLYGKEVDISREIFQAYVHYLAGDAVGAYRKDFLNAVELAKPAWAMIDTGELPPVLNFALSKDIVEAVRKEFDNEDTIIEAEIASTGTSGEEVEHKKLTGEELENYKDKIVLFVKFVGAEGVAYDIGMKHAAKKGEKHEPDFERLKTVQRGLFLELGANIPFAQHGGTGAAKVIKGLVGKNNINTQYLVDAANFFANHYEKNKDAIRAGVKSACGTDIYMNMAVVQAQRAVTKLKETGSFGLVPRLLGA